MYSKYFVEKIYQFKKYFKFCGNISTFQVIWIFCFCMNCFLNCARTYESLILALYYFSLVTHFLHYITLLSDVCILKYFFQNLQSLLQRKIKPRGHIAVSWCTNILNTSISLFSYFSTSEHALAFFYCSQCCLRTYCKHFKPFHMLPNHQTPLGDCVNIKILITEH